MENQRIIVTLPSALKRVVVKASEHRGCSQAEIIKSALYEHLKDFLLEDNKTPVERMVEVVPDSKYDGMVRVISKDDDNW